MPSNKDSRIVFMGTPDFAVPSLAALLDNGWDVVCVVTQPDRPKGRKKVLTAPPVKEEAIRHGLSVFQPEKCRHPDAVETIRSYEPDLIVTAAYGQILPASLLQLPPLGCINVHASLLPRYRGGAPIHHAVMRGESVTGVTIMYMDEGLDTGDMIARVEVPIREQDTTGTLYDKLKAAGARLLLDTIDDIVNGRANRQPQDEAEATYAPNITRDDEYVDWNRPARVIYNHVRGLNPWPVAHTLWNGERLKLWACTIPEASGSSGANDEVPGTVTKVDEQGIDVVTADGLIRITELQPAGKRKMNVAEFVRSGKLEPGTRFGDRA